MELLGPVTMNHISVSPSKQGDAASLSSTLAIQVLSPLGPNSPIVVTSVGMPHGVLSYRSRNVAYLSILPQQAISVGDVVFLNISSQLDIEPDDFAAFLSDLIHEDFVDITLTGRCDANVTTSVLGAISVNGLNISRELTIAGLGGLKVLCILTTHPRMLNLALKTQACTRATNACNDCLRRFMLCHCCYA